MSQFDRIYRIHRLIKGGKRVTRSSLAAELEVSTSQVKRDLAFLREQLQAPLEFDRQRLTFYYDKDQGDFELPGIWFSAEELAALLTVEQLLEGIQPGLLAPRLGPLRHKVRELLELSGHPPDAVSERIRLYAPQRRRVHEAHFGTIAGALLGARPVTIRYHSRSRDQERERTVHPHRLYFYRQNSYLLAWCELERGLRLFALDRVLAASDVDRPLRPADPEELDGFIGRGYGIFGGEPRGRAEIAFSPTAARWVAEEEWHPQQQGEWRDGRYHLTLPYSDLRELTQEVLRFGPDAEAIAPPELREEVSARLQVALRHYAAPEADDTEPAEISRAGARSVNPPPP